MLLAGVTLKQPYGHACVVLSVFVGSCMAVYFCGVSAFTRWFDWLFLSACCIKLLFIGCALSTWWTLYCDKGETVLYRCDLTASLMSRSETILCYLWTLPSASVSFLLSDWTCISILCICPYTNFTVKHVFYVCVCNVVNILGIAVYVGLVCHDCYTGKGDHVKVCEPHIPSCHWGIALCNVSTTVGRRAMVAGFLWISDVQLCHNRLPCRRLVQRMPPFVSCVCVHLYSSLAHTVVVTLLPVGWLKGESFILLPPLPPPPTPLTPISLPNSSLLYPWDPSVCLPDFVVFVCAV